MIKIHDKKHSTDPQLLIQSNQALQKVMARTDLGFFKLPERDQLWHEAEKLGKEFAETADHMVIVGIGGSSLGPKALYEIFEKPQNPKRLYFCDNVDPLEMERLWGRLQNLDRTVWVFVSKSGSTIETLVAADLIFQKCKAESKLARCVVVSEKKGNPLTDWAAKNQIPALEIPVDVGGRFSVLTAVGMLPMAFIGLSLGEFKNGAEKAIKAKELVAEFMTQIIQSYRREEWISFFWFYSSMYQSFGRWIQQLWAESLGKAVDRKGKVAPRASTPVSAIGSTDQHSVLQQVMEGAKDKFVIFTRFSNLEKSGDKIEVTAFPHQKFFLGFNMGQLIAAQAEGTKNALNHQGVSTLTLSVQDLSPSSLGYQLMFWQLVVAGIGELLDIDAFNQPGVELGKRLAKEILVK
jgi:glucose-6-phosphate isomerase